MFIKARYKQQKKGPVIYLLGVFDGAKGEVSNHLLVRALIPLRHLNNSIEHENLAVRRGL